MNIKGNRKPTDNPWMTNAPEKWTKVKLRNLFTEVKEPVGDESEKYTLLSLTTNGVIVRDLSEAKGNSHQTFLPIKSLIRGSLYFAF